MLIRTSRDSADLSPPEAAQQLRHLSGLAFLDSALLSPETGRYSLLAAEPDFVLQGTDWEQLRNAVRRCQQPSSADLGLPTGAAVGTVAYDGSFCFGFHNSLAIFDHAAGQWSDPAGLLQRRTRNPLHGRVGRLPQSNTDTNQFCRQVERIQQYIAAGDIYQANLSHRFEAPWEGDPFAFYRALRHFSPAPFGAFLDQGSRVVLSASPELFLRMAGPLIRTRPIKGTRPRRPDAQEDERSAYELITSEKELAELIMITDLERNDLGKVCEYGTVRVPELLRLERFEQVFHLASTVEGTLRDGMDHVAAMRACFPGGSITGAPKRRAMEIIEEIESVPRGLYTGAIGYFGYNGESQFNIAIRTAVAEQGTLHFHAGAGIVADSVPEREYEETLHKATGLLLAAEACL